MANIIVTLLKDEDNLLVDFILYHLSIDFDKIIIFDDCSEIPVSTAISALPKMLINKVECHRMPSEFNSWRENPPAHLFDKEIFSQYSYAKQMYVCNYALAHFCKVTDWVAFTDVDEFVWLPEGHNIEWLRGEIQRHGFSAMILNMLMYGHSFNLEPPPNNNLCAYLWRSRNLFGHGKFFAHVGAIQVFKTPHIPNMRASGLVCDALFRAREAEYDWDIAKTGSLMMPHLKHYTILDVKSCFLRRMRVPISQTRSLRPEDGTWTSRVEMMKWSSSETDVDLAALIILKRAQLGLEVAAHVRAMSRALDRMEDFERTSSTLDFEFLRSRMGRHEDESDAALLFRFFSMPDIDMTMLRFWTLPDDFDEEAYKSLNGDLKFLTSRELRQHYANYGRFEKRSYRQSSL